MLKGRLHPTEDVNAHQMHPFEMFPGYSIKLKHYSQKKARFGVLFSTK